MKEHHKTNRLTVITILLVIVIAVILISSKSPRLTYNVEADVVLSELKEEANFIKPDDLKNMVSDENIELIDLRNSGDFFVSHIEGAKNIPLIKILDEEVLSTFDVEEKTFVLYGKDHVESNGVWVLLRQLGYQNIKVLLGGYENYLSLGKEYPEYLGSYEELIMSQHDISDEITKLSKKIAEEDAAKMKNNVSQITTRKAKPAKKAKLPPVIIEEDEVDEDEGC